MKKIIYLLTVVALITIAACKQDKCDGVVCQNGGTCNEGVCQCNSAFTGERCETHTNGCDTTRCYNGGNCVNSICNCPAHTSGDSCTILETPSKMYITGVRVYSYNPANLLGEAWEQSESLAEQAGPDIYTVITRNGTPIFNGFTRDSSNTSYTYKKNVTYNTEYWMPFYEDSIALTSDMTDSIYGLELWDHDLNSSDDLMHKFLFRPFTGRNGFPDRFSYHDTSFYYDKFEYRIHYSPNYEW